MKIYALDLYNCTCLEKDTHLFNYVYLDGELEKENKYDLVSTETLEEQNIEPGIYDVEVYLHTGILRPGRLYYWKCFGDIKKGLIVNPNNEEDVSHAKELYDNKVPCI